MEGAAAVSFTLCLSFSCYNEHMNYFIGPSKLDKYIYSRFERLSNRRIAFLHRGLMWLAAYGPLLMVALVLGFTCSKWRHTASVAAMSGPVVAICGAALSRVVNSIVRRCLYRPRPHVEYSTEPLLVHKPTSSFPSNHAAGAFALAIPLLPAAPGLGACMLLLAVLLSVSRLYVKLHYVTDVLAGAAIGAGTSCLLWWLANGLA